MVDLAVDARSNLRMRANKKRWKAAKTRHLGLGSRKLTILLLLGPIGGSAARKRALFDFEAPGTGGGPLVQAEQARRHGNHVSHKQPA